MKVTKAELIKELMDLGVKPGTESETFDMWESMKVDDLKKMVKIANNVKKGNSQSDRG